MTLSFHNDNTKTMVILLGMFQLFSCQKKEGKSTIETTNNTAMETPICLQSQLIAGYSAEKSETDYPNYNFKESDLDCSIPLLENELKKRGYKFPSSTEFETKVFEVFNRKIDYSKATKYLYIDGDDPCKKGIIYTKNSDDELTSKSYYLVKNKGFITELLSIPEIVDYSKEFLEAKKYEEQEISNNQGDIKIIKWSEVKELSQIRYKNIEKLVNRNLFLFNDKNEQLTWLLFNDESFIEMLSKVYGYDKNEKINLYFIKKIISNKDINRNIGFFLHENCDKKLAIHEGFINSFKNHLNTSRKPNEAILLKNIASQLMSNSEYTKYSKEDKVKAICYLANVFDPLFKTHHNEDSEWGTLTILADAKDYYDTDWSEITSIIIKNNYYNLPNLKMALDYAEQFDSVGAPD